MPDQPLPTALLGLMLLQHSWRDARVDSDGRAAEALGEFDRAIARCGNEAERDHLVRRRVETARN